MRPVTFTVTNAVSSAWIKLELKTTPFNVGFGVTVVSGTPTYTIEHTFDDVDASSPTPTVFAHATVAAQTTSKDGNYAFPIRAMRVTQTGTGVTRITIIQAGERG